MENRALRWFVEMANERSMSRAAQRLHVTQPTMSRQLKELEEELGTKLFLRTNYAIRLTDAGEVFLRRAKDILALVDKTEDEFRKTKEKQIYSVNVGCPESDSVKYIARTVKKLRDGGVPMVCHFHSGNAESVLERLNKGLDDIALVLDYVDTVRYHCIPLPAHDIWGVVMKKDHPLATRKRLTTDDLLDEPLIISRQAAEQIFPVWFGDRRNRLNIVASFNLAYNASLFVKEGIGIAVSLDKIVNVSEHSDLVFRPITGVADSQMKLVWRQNTVLSKSAQLLINAIKREFRILED